MLRFRNSSQCRQIERHRAQVLSLPKMISFRQICSHCHRIVFPKSSETEEPKMPSFRSVVHPRDEIMQTMDRIYRYRMTTTSGGNLSIKDDSGDIWISPARVDKGNLSRHDIVCVKPDGTVEGQHPASSEFPFHKAIYEARPDIRSIVHAHPIALVAFSICQQTPNTRLFHQAHSICGKVGFAPYACPGSEALGQSIASTFRDGCDSVILENHGVVVGGRSLTESFERFEAFEFAGKTLIKAQQ